MAYAYCNNDECENDRWWLTKPPSDYADGGPSCPECGSTRVSMGNETASAETATVESGETTREADAAPARREQQSADTPDTRDDSGDEKLPQSAVGAAEAGQKMAGLVASIGGSSPEEQANATEKIATAGGAMIAQLGQRAAQQQRENAERAKNASQDDISRVEDYVSCPACSKQITDLPPAGQQFNCPHCGELLKSEG